MPSLHELQSSLKDAVLATSKYGRHAASGLDTVSVSRLHIYRNNTLISLTEALKAVFPVTVKIVDERFFSYLAASFIHTHPPTEPRLSAYGAQLPSFITSFEACDGLPYLADVARLEWFVNEAIHAAEPSSLSVTGLASFDPQTLMTFRLALQPSLRLIASRHPVFAIWQAHQTDVRETIGPARRAFDRLAIWRRGAGIAVSLLTSGQLRFLRDLAVGRGVGAALERAAVRDSSFDPTRELLALFQQRLVTGIETHVFPKATELPHDDVISVRQQRKHLDRNHNAHLRQGHNRTRATAYVDDPTRGTHRRS